MTNRKAISGPLRLGIFLSIAWILLSAAAYLIAARMNPPFLYTYFEWAYAWWEDAPTPGTTIDFRAFWPEASVSRASMLILGVPVVLWLLLFVLPKSVSWVAEGFHDTPRE